VNVAILWKHWNDYLEAGLDELSSVPGVAVLICDIRSQARPTTSADLFAGVQRCHLEEGEASIAARLEQFRPDLLVVCGWDIPQYRRFAHAWRGRSVRVLYMDNQWLGTARQFVGVMSAPIYLWRCFDAVFVTGTRQVNFARRLGFSSRRIQTGGIVADTRKFRGPSGQSGFLFVGRLVPAKGIDSLVDGYRIYRARRADAWPLQVCGEGAEAHRLANVEGVTQLGFVHPSKLPDVMSNTSCLVLPSHFEPFGVVVHEAAAMGLHIIASRAVGAADLFVNDRVNGRVVRTGNPEDLADALLWMHTRTAEERATGAQRSIELASQQSPATWAAALISLGSRFDLRRRCLLRARLRRGLDIQT
jgi:glycosyltransferase involved in cell wall biosynthesis